MDANMEHISSKYANVRYIDEKNMPAKNCSVNKKKQQKEEKKKKKQRRFDYVQFFFQFLIVFPQNMAQILSRTNSNTLNRKSKKPPDDVRN